MRWDRGDLWLCWRGKSNRKKSNLVDKRNVRGEARYKLTSFGFCNS